MWDLQWSWEQMCSLKLLDQMIKRFYILNRYTSLHPLTETWLRQKQLLHVPSERLSLHTTKDHRLLRIPRWPRRHDFLTVSGGRLGKVCFPGYCRASLVFPLFLRSMGCHITTTRWQTLAKNKKKSVLVLIWATKATAVVMDSQASCTENIELRFA